MCVCKGKHNETMGYWKWQTHTDWILLWKLGLSLMCRTIEQNSFSFQEENKNSQGYKANIIFSLMVSKKILKRVATTCLARKIQTQKDSTKASYKKRS